MMVKSTNTASETATQGAGEMQKRIARGNCPKCDQPSEIEDLGRLTQCMFCGLLMGNELKNEIIENRQTVMTVSDEFDNQYEMI